jgi:hypothetical protein
MYLSRDSALAIAVRHIAEEATKTFQQLGDQDVKDGWPEGVYHAHDIPDEVWAVTIPDISPRVGASRVLVISKATGKVWAFDNIGD